MSMNESLAEIPAQYRPSPVLASDHLGLQGFSQLDVDADYAVIQVAIGITIRDQRQGISDILSRHHRECRHVSS